MPTVRKGSSSSASQTTRKKWGPADDKHLSHLILTKKIDPTNRSKATILKLLEEPQWRNREYKGFAQLIRGKLERVETDRILKGGRGFRKTAGE